MTILGRTMNKRTALNAADLYVLLQREFKRRQAPTCGGCFMQLPYRVDREESEGANWEVMLPQGCGHNCRALAEELVDEFRMLYDLSPEAGH